MTKNQAGDRNVVRDAKARPSPRGFYLALGAVVLLGVAIVGYAWRRSADATGGTVVDPSAAAALQAPGYVRGSPNAPIEIIEFGDFECPGCGKFAIETEPEMRAKLIETGIARFRFFDLQVNPSHRNSPAASVAAACANDQGKFWEMHDRIFAGQAEWSSTATLQPKPVLQGYATALGLDAKSWEACFDAQRHVENLALHAAEAKRVGLRSTPSLLIGNRVLVGAQPYVVVKAAVDSALAESKAAPPGKPTGD
jgi:protein-disulfide isomerase